MPIYEYQCAKCKKKFEVITMSMSEKPAAVCPKCKSRKTNKMMSTFAHGKHTSSSENRYGNASASGSSGCSSCSSSNCSSCRH